MHFGVVDIYAVSAASIASVLLGYLWYSDFLFRKQWIKSMGRTPAQFSRESKKFDKCVELVLSLLTSFVMAAVFAGLLNMLQAENALGGILVGIYIWMGFVVIVLGSMVFHEGRHSDYFLITAGHRLIELMMMGAILSAMR